MWVSADRVCVVGSSGPVAFPERAVGSGGQSVGFRGGGVPCSAIISRTLIESHLSHRRMGIL